jgi:hypothetical protein
MLFDYDDIVKLVISISENMQMIVDKKIKCSLLVNYSLFTNKLYLIIKYYN